MCCPATRCALIVGGKEEFQRQRMSITSFRCGAAGRTTSLICSLYAVHAMRLRPLARLASAGRSIEADRCVNTGRPLTNTNERGSSG
jgi:hypothetical protein